MFWVMCMIIAVVALVSDALARIVKYRSQTNPQELTQLLEQLREEHTALHEELAAVDEKVSSIEKMLKEV